MTAPRNDHQILKSTLAPTAATAFDPQQDAITEWIEMTTVANDTVLKVDRDGTGGTYSMEQIAALTGVTGLTDEAALVTSGNLLLAA